MSQLCVVKVGVLRWRLLYGKGHATVLRFECNGAYGEQSWSYVGGYWTVRVMPLY